MKCEVCLEQLEEYLDGELATEAQTQVSAHLVTCAACAASFNALSAEQQLFARYDREVEVPPFLWTRIAQYTLTENEAQPSGWRAFVAALFATRPGALASAVGVLLLAITIGFVYWISGRPSPQKPPVETVARVDRTFPANPPVVDQAGGSQTSATPNAAPAKDAKSPS